MHQTRKCVTAAGLHLFAYFLQRSDQLMILFKPVYLTRVWCVYELAWWLKEKGNAGIVLVPLTGTANLYRLLLRIWPIYWAWGGFCLSATFASLLFVTGRCGDKEFEDASKKGYLSGMTVEEMRAQAATLFVGCVVLSIVPSLMFLYTLSQTAVSPVEEERKDVAHKLRSFDVRNTEAFLPSDKDFVLGEIQKWWGLVDAGTKVAELSEGAEQEAALERFNDLVRTRVAKRLDELQQRLKWQVVFIVVLLFVMGYVYCVLMLLLVARYFTPFGWPDFFLVLGRFVSPNACYEEDSNSKCFGAWEMGPSALVFCFGLVVFGSAICVCCASLGWAKDRTPAPVYRICGVGCGGAQRRRGVSPQ